MDSNEELSLNGVHLLSIIFHPLDCQLTNGFVLSNIVKYGGHQLGQCHFKSRFLGHNYG